MSVPVVFISYSHDSDAHKLWVLKLATDLRANGVDAVLDQWDLSLGQDMAAFMQKGIANSNRVLLVCSEPYVKKADEGSGGVGYERLIVTVEVIQNIDTKKFIPVLRNNPSSLKVPRFLGPRFYIDFSEDAQYKTKLEELLREIFGAPAQVKPPLGANPFSAAPPSAASPARVAGPTGATATGAPILDDQWFKEQAASARKSSAKLKVAAHMELRFALHSPINKSQIELLNAVQKSEIKTFGWPIGVTLDNRTEYRPRPFADGIRAEIAIEKDTMMGRTSYDYWALRSNGDFYLLQNLFEDMRDEKKIFFNTRIVRVTEALLFAGNLYGNLGAAPDTRLSVRVAHDGLAGRILTSASFNRHIFPKQAHDNESQVEIAVVLGSIRDSLVDDVRRILAPMFMLFDFTEFSDQVYTDIVRRFEKGEPT